MTDEPKEDHLQEFLSDDLRASFLNEISLIGTDFRHQAFLSSFRVWGHDPSAPAQDLNSLLEKDGIDPSSSLGMAMFSLRDQYIQEFGFCVPTKPFVDRLAQIGPLLEVGAGQGYLAKLIKNAGGDIISTDLHPHDPQSNWVKVLEMDAQTAISEFPGRTLLSSWPSRGDDWLTKAIKVLPKDQNVIIIGEGPTGCTGSRCLFNLIGNQMVQDDTLLADTDVWRFPRIHDTAQAFRRQ